MDVTKIPMTDVLDRLGIQYYNKTWNEYWVIENWVKTDGRTFQTRDNLMCNNTPWKDYRPNWNNINVVMRAKSLDKEDAKEWLREEFWYSSSTKKSSTQQPSVSAWNWYKAMTAEGRKYLASRWVDYSKVKDIVKWNSGGIAMRVHKRDKECWIVTRNTDNTSKQRFWCEKWTDGKGVYVHWLELERDTIYVTEWFFDFLTLRQFTPNVIWLRSAKDGYNEVKRYAKTHKLILIPHKDDAGNNMVNELKEFGVKMFDVWIDSRISDLNDFFGYCKPYEKKDEIVDIINDGAVDVVYTDGKITWKAYDYPDWPFERDFWCLKSWELVLIAAASNNGKTSFVLNLLKKNYNQWKKVGMINMEFDLEDWFRTEFFRARWVRDADIKKQDTDKCPIDAKTKKELNEYIAKRKSEVDIIDMDQSTPLDNIMNQLRTMKKMWYTLVAVDSLSSIWKCSDSLDAQNDAMKEMLNFCKSTWMVVILIHHFNKWWKQYSWSTKIKDLSNVMIQIFAAESIKGSRYRVFTLEKDKPHQDVPKCHTYYNRWNYVEVPEEDRDAEYID